MIDVINAELDLDLVELEIELATEPFIQYLWGKIHTVSHDTIVSLVVGHRYRSKKHKIQDSAIKRFLDEKMAYARKRASDDFVESLRYKPYPVDLVEQIARQITQSNYEDMYTTVLRHVIWTVKRRIFQKDDYCPIFLNIYGSAGAGKSEFVRAFTSIFPPGEKISVSCADELVNDERSQYKFIESSFIVLDELSGLSKADIGKLKTIIDQKQVSYRVLGGNTTQTGRNRAQLLGTSNTRLSNIILADSDIRKWAEIDFYKFEEDVSGNMVSKLHSIDWLALWQSVDENGPSPMHNPETYSAYCKWTERKCTHVTPTLDYIYNHICTHAGEFVAFNDMYDDYKSKTDNSMSKPRFKELIEKKGFEKKRTSASRGYVVPTKEAATKYFDESLFDEITPPTKRLSWETIMGEK